MTALLERIELRLTDSRTTIDKMLERHPELIQVQSVGAIHLGTLAPLPRLIDIDDENAPYQEGSRVINIAHKERFCSIPMKLTPNMNLVVPIRPHCQPDGMSLMVLQEPSNSTPFATLDQFDQEDLGILFRSIANGVAQISKDQNNFVVSVGDTAGAWRSEPEVEHIHITAHTKQESRYMIKTDTRNLPPDIKNLYSENEVGIEAAYLALEAIQDHIGGDPVLSAILSPRTARVYSSGVLEFEIGNSLRLFLEARAPYVWPRLNQIMRSMWEEALRNLGYSAKENQYCGATVALQYASDKAILRTVVAVKMDPTSPLNGGGIFTAMEMHKLTSGTYTNDDSLDLYLRSAQLAKNMLLAINDNAQHYRVDTIIKKLTRKKYGQ